MSTTNQPHRGFDYDTTTDGESVPTCHDRNLARALRALPCVQSVGWSGTRGCLTVTGDDLAKILLTAGEAFDGREAGIQVTREDTRTRADHRVLIKADR